MQSNNKKGKNLITAYYEGGNRQEIRAENMLTAFTYGMPVKLKELDDPP